MIIDTILNCFFGIVNFILSPLEVLNWVFNTSVISFLSSVLRVIYYILPIQKLLPIITFIVAMFIFRSVISLIKTIWDLIPLL